MVESSGRGAERDWRYDGHEILADGLVHGLGLALAVVGTVTLLGLLITRSGDVGTTAAHAIYCLTLLVTLGASAAYNLWPVSRVKWALRRLDHAMIFGLIAGPTRRSCPASAASKPTLCWPRSGSSAWAAWC